MACSSVIGNKDGKKLSFSMHYLDWSRTSGMVLFHIAFYLPRFLGERAVKSDTLARHIST
jgi:hypothetical protein